MYSFGTLDQRLAEYNDRVEISMVDVVQIRRKLEACNQSHLLRHLDRLDQAQQARLLEQVATIDWDRLSGLISRYVLGRPSIDLPVKIEPPPIEPAAATDPTAAEYKAARKRGLELIAAGKVAAFVVAGGQGTRLGYEGLKGCLEATPVTRKPLFQLLAEQILASGRRAGVAVPWYVMTSPANDVATRAFFRRRRFFGLEQKDVFFLVQGTMPVISLDGKVLLAKPDEPALSPNGHGGSLQALHASGALDDMAARGVEIISHFQVDNPLVRCVDPLFIGLHELRGAEMSAKALPKRSPIEKLGNFCLVDGKVTVIEYSDLPEELAQATTDDGHLRLRAGSIAIHLLNRSFVARLTEDGPCDLPFHRAEKKVAYVDEAGQLIRPEKPNAVKLEMFIFDALAMAEKVVILETLRSEEFSPIKNASGPNSLATSLHDQIRRAAAWLEEADIVVPRDADGQVAAAIEISPLFADSAEELIRKVDPNMTITSGQSLYLGSRGQTGGLR